MKIRNLPNFGINSSFFLFILAFKFRIYNKKNQHDKTRSKTNNNNWEVILFVVVPERIFYQIACHM